MPTIDAWEKISTITLTGTYGTVTFSSIPSTYEVLVVSVVNLCVTNGREFGIRFNSDSGNNYDYCRLIAEGAGTFTAGSGTGGTYGRIGDSNTSYSTHLVTIPNYRNTSMYKTCYTETVSNDNSSTNNRAAHYITTWKSSSAITSLSFVNELGSNHDVNSIFSLYGLKG